MSINHPKANFKPYSYTLEIQPHITFQMLSFSFFIYGFQLSNSTERKITRKIKFKNEVKE